MEWYLSRKLTIKSDHFQNNHQGYNFLVNSIVILNVFSLSRPKWQDIENKKKDLPGNFMVGAYFGSNHSFIVSSLERYLSGAFFQPHLDFCYWCHHGLHPIHYFIITNRKGSTYFRLKIHPCLTWNQECKKNIAHAHFWLLLLCKIGFWAFYNLPFLYRLDIEYSISL